MGWLGVNTIRALSEKVGRLLPCLSRTAPCAVLAGAQRRIESALSAERVERPCLSQTMPHATIGPPSGPRLRQPYRAPKNAPVVAYHCGHIVRKPTPNTRTPPAQTKQNFEDHWNERKWDRGRGLELAQRLDWPAESWGAPQLATDAPGAAMARAPYSDAMRRLAPDREAGPLAPRLGQSCGSCGLPYAEADPCAESCNPILQQAADAGRLRPHRLRVGGARLLGPTL